MKQQNENKKWMEGWKKSKFNDIADFPPKIKMERGEEYPFVLMDEVDAGFKYVKASFSKKYNGSGAKFENRDTLFARITPSLENGKIAQVKGINTPAFGSTEFFVFRGKKNISDNNFIYYLSKTDWFRQNAINSMVGASGRQRADAKFVGKTKLLIPPLPTQRRIASILSAYDDLIENNLNRIKLLEEMAQITYEDWFVRMKFPGHEHAKFDKETGLPEGWEKVKLGEVCDFKYGKMPKKQLQKETGYPIFSGYRITGYYPEFHFGEPIIVVVARGVGGTGDVKLSPRNCWLTNLSIAVLVKKDIYKNYLYYHLKDLNLKYLDSGAAQSQITINSLEHIYIIKPIAYVQNSFNDYVELLLKEVENLRTQNQRLKEARDILLPRLMTGMVDPDKVSGQVVDELEGEG